MKHDKLIKQAARLAEPFCVTKGEKFRLKDWDPADTTGVKNKQHAQSILDAREGVLNTSRRNFTRKTAGRSGRSPGSGRCR